MCCPSAAASFSGPELRPEALELLQHHITPEQASGTDEDSAIHAAQQAAAAAAAAATIAAGKAAAQAGGDEEASGSGASAPAGPPPIAVYQGSGAKVPKWMKLGPK